jgi:glycosyltransferase involved in cell wall biosynthesis
MITSTPQDATERRGPSHVIKLLESYAMKILMFSINPLFPEVVMGGAPKHLRNIATHMGTLGHSVTVLCTRSGTHDAFQWADNVRVLPILPFHQPFPQPYAVPNYDLAAALQIVGDHLATVDRFYMHDGEFLFPYAYGGVPTVVSLRDNVYPETLLGSFHFQGDKLVLISEYSRDYFLATAGRFFPGMGQRVVVIPNGLDWGRFRPTPARRILDMLPADVLSRPIILHPHRPEESKGIRQTIAVVDRLVHHHGLGDVLALAPRWLDMQLTPELGGFYQDILDTIHTRGLERNIYFHDWIPQPLMPEYFSLGAVTLSLGHFAESFGNAVYESMGCGTPTITARISTHRTLLPDGLIDKVDYGDVDSAAEIAAKIIREKQRTSPAALAYLHEHYHIDRQLAAYADVIQNAQSRPPLAYRHPAIGDDTGYRLAPWCYNSPARGIYHDFLADYLHSPALQSLISAFPDGFSLADAASEGTGTGEFQRWIDLGYVIPLMES